MEAHYTITQLVVVIGGRPVVKQDEGFNFKTSNWRGHYFRAREIALLVSNNYILYCRFYRQVVSFELKELEV